MRYLLKQISVRHENIAKKKAVAERERERGWGMEMNGLHRKDLFFLHPNMKCHLSQCGWLFYFAPTFFLPSISLARIFDGVSHWCDS